MDDLGVELHQFNPKIFYLHDSKLDKIDLYHSVMFCPSFFPSPEQGDLSDWGNGTFQRQIAGVEGNVIFGKLAPKTDAKFLVPKGMQSFWSQNGCKVFSPKTDATVLVPKRMPRF